MGAAKLDMWTVYWMPSDRPDAIFLARRSEIGHNGIFVTTDTREADDLDVLRAMLPPGLTCLSRHPDDDPVILEIWF